MGDFIRGKASSEFGEVEPSYKPGVRLGDLAPSLPDYVIEAIREALPEFGKQIRGFDRDDAILTGIETRTSSPVRITRDHETLQSLNTRGLYPAGEGAGYAGGILSAGVDGIKVAEAVAKALKTNQVAVFKQFGTAQVGWKGMHLEFVGARKESYRTESRKPIVEDGTLEDDQRRRDFTINALYYDPSNERILDYANGVHDIRNHLIRLIGDPTQRYQEDPVRMLRAVRFAAKLDFDIEKHSAAPIYKLAPMLREIPAARLFEEVLKLFLAGYAVYTYELLVDYGLFGELFPASAAALKHNPDYTDQLIRNALSNTDLRIQQGKTVTPAFLFAALLWPALPARVIKLQDRGMPPIPAMQEAAHELISEQCLRIAVPKRFTLPIREIWDMQERLPRRSGKRADMLLENPRFRAGYDFLLLRESAGEETDGLGDWWTLYQDASDSERRSMIRDLSSKDDGPGAPRKRKRSSSKRKRSPAADGSSPSTGE